MRNRLVSRLLPRSRAVAAVRWSLLMVLGILSALGVHHAGTRLSGQPAESAPTPERKAANLSTLFSGMRPRQGDRMAPPRIGFRWSFEDAGAADGVVHASFMPPLRATADTTVAMAGKGIRFLLHILGPGGKPEITKETLTPEVQLSLKEGFPEGECEWWVEALVPGAEPITSPRKKFVLDR